MDKVRLAVIGCGNHCTGQLMPGIPYVPELNLVAVCDLKEELARRNARHFGASAYYVDFQNRRADYIAGFMKVADWEAAGKRFAQALKA